MLYDGRDFTSLAYFNIPGTWNRTSHINTERMKEEMKEEREQKFNHSLQQVTWQYVPKALRSSTRLNLVIPGIMIDSQNLS